MNDLFDYLQKQIGKDDCPIASIHPVFGIRELDMKDGSTIKIRDNWGATAMSFSKDSKCYINLWDGDYPKMIEITNDTTKNFES